ncbi:glycosyltransferase involved in cell wall biosynthesis [Paraburkholderia caballeronis]|uniref:glycosyltransferase family 2 protein n=1 Tax=Paraburkholderia caballeronis TaxID=416943 RepID=UPI001066DA00|nr:glycosyltransferase [Paraburkholderia caballeronis]TDV24052.1 glycosyltransferase involved in cell wall biosynthesis [Paraburkholderia caballeronis]
MSSTGKVSIVVPCFNQERFIGETLQSVAAQGYRDWECIVVDDGSTDGSADIIASFVQSDPRFRYIHKPNSGVAASRNLGFAHATGSYFLPLDGDDRLHPDFLASVMDCFGRHPAATLVHCRTRLFGAKNRIWRLPDYSYEKLLLQNMLVNSAVFRRDAFERSGGYSEEMVHGFEDWEFYVRLLDPQSEVRLVKKPLFYYRVKEVSRTTEQIQSGRVEESMRLIYARNSERYRAISHNPIGVFSRRMKDFAPTFTARYKRQITYLHTAYLLVIVSLVGILVTTLVSEPKSPLAGALHLRSRSLSPPPN